MLSGQRERHKRITALSVVGRAEWHPRLYLYKLLLLALR